LRGIPKPYQANPGVSIVRSDPFFLSVTQAEKIAPAVKETPGQKLRREIERSRQQQQQRRSGGMHI
jgi:hypothetical protein